MSITKFSATGLSKLVLLLTGAGIAHCAFAAPSTAELDVRLSALEMRLESNYARLGKLERTSNSDLMLEIVRRLDALEQDNANLRGMLEVNQNQLEKQIQNFRKLSLELDQRLENLTTEQGLNTETEVEPASSAIDPVAERKLYEVAFNKLRAGNNAVAISEFAKYLNTYPQGRFADNAQYWLAEAYYIDGKMKNAQNAFNNLLKKYPRSAKVPDALLKLGYIAIDSGKAEQAKKLLAKVERKYPSSNAAKLAKKRLLALGN